MATRGEAYGAAADRDLELFRSGSAPPTVESAMASAAAAAGGVFLDEELRADPAYQSYYYSNAHLNPRLPPPPLSKEDWRSAQHRLRSSGLGGIGDGRRQPAAAQGDGLVGLPGIDLGRQGSISSIFQENSYQRDMDKQGANHNGNNFLDSSRAHYTLHRETRAIGDLHSDSNLQNLADVQNNDSSTHSYASLLGSSLSRSASPDPELVRRVSSPCLPPIGVKVSADDKNNNVGSSSFHRCSSAKGESDNLIAALSGMNLSSPRAASGQTMNQSKLYQDVGNAHNFLFDRQGDQSNGNQEHSYMKHHEQGRLKAPDGYPANSPNSSVIRDQINAATTLQTPIDPMYIQYLQAADLAAQVAASCDDPLMASGHLGSSYMDLLGPQKAHLSPLLQSQKNSGYYGNLGFGLGYAGSPLMSPVLSSSPAVPGSPLRHGEHSMHLQSGMINFGGSFGSWNSDLGGKMNVNLMPSLLEEFKSNKNKSYELSEISGHVVGFRWSDYNEIMPQALTLMTNVFGNYVVQKFFEYESPTQIKELAAQLIGHVLALTLQMYGCRVIQKKSD
ncbi:hypothetical protein GUJ93_ZPchr0010g10991 [Zizania palustris]|uniref:PUM-HD domain-containing protein n=1 Tax=Zizania palustris TaxID=103762 RepID=A0A8J5W7Z0_ZIZPA|nr:hypothetical protein GUJ93_ZPchr0010g10991 [Zizania palustris]